MCLLGIMTFDLIFFHWFWGDQWFWFWMISSVSERYITKRLLDCFHTAHTHPSGGVDVPFGGYDLWPNCWPSILGPFIDFNWWRMTSSDSGWYLRKHLLICFHIAFTYPSGGVDVPFGDYDLWPFFLFDFEAINKFNWWQKISSFSGW